MIIDKNVPMSIFNFLLFKYYFAVEELNGKGMLRLKK